MDRTARRRRDSRGFTIVEIAIVLVVIGLLLGGILKGQELINNAKVRALTDRTTSLGIAFRSFVTRYNYPPGDFEHADTYLGFPSSGGYSGNGNRLIDMDGSGSDEERALVFTHLAAAGLIECSAPACTGTYGDSIIVRRNQDASLFPTNLYGGGFEFRDKQVNRQYLRTYAEDRARFYLATGDGIPSTVLSEMDRKIDDGIASGGDFRSRYKQCTYSARRNLRTGEPGARLNSNFPAPNEARPELTLVDTDRGITHHEWEFVDGPQASESCAGVLLL